MIVRRVASALLACLLAACGSSSSSSGNPYGFDFDRFDYNGVVALPLTAFREDRPTNGDEDGGVQAALFERVRDDATNMTDIPFQADWNTMLGLLANGQPDDRIAMRFFLAYEVEHNPTAGTCTVRIHVIEGVRHPTRGGEVHRQAPPLRRLPHVEAHVRRDPVEPCAQRGSALERVGTVPGTQHRFLDGVLGIGVGAEEAIAVADELGTVLMRTDDYRARRTPTGSTLATAGLAAGTGATWA